MYRLTWTLTEDLFRWRQVTPRDSAAPTMPGRLTAVRTMALTRNTQAM